MALIALNLSACGDGSEGDSTSVSIVTTPSPVITPPPSISSATFVSEHFSGSGNCAVCHNGIFDENGSDVSIETDWSSSMMANATRDPFWIAKVKSELNRNPDLTDLINDKCSRCHAPMANEEMRRSNEPIS